LNETFSYIDCMEELIHFDYILDEILLAATLTEDMNPIVDTIYNIAIGVMSNLSVIYNDKLYQTMDINSGVMTYKKLRK